jgi:hypothetical protein
MKKPSLLKRLRLKKTTRSPVVGITWYNEDNWARTKADALDPSRFEATYQDWLAMAEDALNDIKKTGINAVPFLIDARELAAWCSANHKMNDAAARAEFVTTMLHKKN